MGAWVVSRGLKAPLVRSSPSLLLSLSPHRNISYLVSYRTSRKAPQHGRLLRQNGRANLHNQVPLQLRWKDPPPLSRRQAPLHRRRDSRFSRLQIGALLRFVIYFRLVCNSVLFCLDSDSDSTNPLVLNVTLRFLCAELLLKLGELYGSAVSLRCQLPTEDLDALVSITCDEDLSNLIEEYDRANRERSDPLKIRAFLAPPKSKPSPPSTATGRKKPYPAVGFPPRSIPTADRCASPHQISAPVRFPVLFAKSAGNRSWLGKSNENSVFLVHNGNHWQ